MHSGKFRGFGRTLIPLYTTDGGRYSFSSWRLQYKHCQHQCIKINVHLVYHRSVFVKQSVLMVFLFFISNIRNCGHHFLLCQQKPGKLWDCLTASLKLMNYEHFCLKDNNFCCNSRTLFVEHYFQSSHSFIEDIKYLSHLTLQVNIDINRKVAVSVLPAVIFLTDIQGGGGRNDKVQQDKTRNLDQLLHLEELRLSNFFFFVRHFIPFLHLQKMGHK